MSDDFEFLPRSVLHSLLDGGVMWALLDEKHQRPSNPQTWPLDSEGRTFLYRALARRLAARGHTSEAARSIRRDLQSGLIRTVVCRPDGCVEDIAPTRWEGGEADRMFWTAKASYPAFWTGDGRYEGVGDIFVVDVPLQSDVPIYEAVARQNWWPRNGQLLKDWCAPGGAAELAAHERLRSRGVRSTEKGLCAELSAMWSAAGGVGGSAKSIETTRRRLR